MEQIHEAEGGPAGGENMDRRLIKLVAELFGEKIWSKFANEHSRHYAKFRESVENAKIELEYEKIRDDFNDNVMLTVPEGVLRELAVEMGEEDLAVAIEKRGKDLVNGRLKHEHGHLCFDVDVVREIMLESVAEVLKYIKNVIESEKENGRFINAVILVGGFALSDFMFKAIKKDINNLQIIRPLYCSIAVLRGAVFFGQNESLLNVRIARLTYGIATNKPFVRGDPEERKVKYDGKFYVKDHFSKHVTRGQEVKINEWTVPSEYKPRFKSDTQSECLIYATDKYSPLYIDEENCTCIGKVMIKYTRNRDKSDFLDVSFNFGRTELLVKVTYRATGHSVIKTIHLKD